MKESVYQEKLATLKRKKEQLIKLINKEEEKLLQYRANLEKIESQILLLNHKHSGLSSDELAEALELYKKQKAEAEKESATNNSDNSVNSSFTYGGQNK